ncbi:MAG: phosphopentomutase [Rhodospirillales bacterium]|nr:phosphopentomutase [Rhodospirillales bacterium]
MTRAFILVMDSFGVGATADAARYGDAGSDTLGHIAAACRDGRADRAGLRAGPLRLPNLARLGLGLAAADSTGQVPPGLEPPARLSAAYGCAAEISAGKDTPSGHWEIAGLPVSFDWGYFPRTRPCFPPDFVAELVRRCELPGILGDCHASGTEIIRELGEEHVRTGKPICYTSADSVFQIAAHESHFGLQRLYRMCAVAKELLLPLNIARVIARPFVGDSADTFVRTANRKDLTTPPYAETLLDRLVEAGGTVVSVGKIADIFARRGISRSIAAKDNMALFDATLAEADAAGEKTLVFANFVDFDTLFGHRRDVPGYAAALEAFDRRLPELETKLRPGDLVLITADHGCDPTWTGTDHTREHVPMLWFGPGVSVRDLGRRDSFADMGQTLARHFALAPLAHGKACFAS